eukprot:1886272-Pleurochrysis_carterae.AAC.5
MASQRSCHDSALRPNASTPTLLTGGRLRTCSATLCISPCCNVVQRATTWLLWPLHHVRRSLSLTMLESWSRPTSSFDAPRPSYGRRGVPVPDISSNAPLTVGRFTLR